MSTLLSLAFFIPQVLQPQSAVLAATKQTPTPSQVGNGPDTPPHLTAQDITFGNEKQQLSNEYMSMLQGKEPLTVYEQHMTAFMQKYNLGNVANLHTVLAKGPNSLLSRKAKVAAGSGSKQTKISPECPNNCIPTGAAQFPEEQVNYCSDAAVSTILVEDSFQWAGVLNNNGHSIQYNQYKTSQDAYMALSDENMLASAYLGNSYNPNLPPYQQPGAGADKVLSTLNDFVNNHGGNYAWVGGNANFQNNLIADINTGWDLAGGLYITGYSPTLPGYPVGLAFQHWIPITYYTNGGATTYYADPIYLAPGYPSSNGWNVQGPYANVQTSTLSAVLSRDGYIW